MMGGIPTGLFSHPSAYFNSSQGSALNPQLLEPRRRTVSVRLGRPSCDRRLHRNGSHMRRDDPLVLRMKLHVQPDPDPPEFQTTPAEAGPAQTGAGALRKERPALDIHVPRVWLKDRDLVDGVPPASWRRPRPRDPRPPCGTPPRQSRPACGGEAPLWTWRSCQRTWSRGGHPRLQLLEPIQHNHERRWYLWPLVMLNDEKALGLSGISCRCFFVV